MTPPPEAVTGAGTATEGPEDPSGGGRGFLFVLIATPVLLILSAVLVWVVVSRDADREPATIQIVVPAGTQDRLDAGEQVVVMPTRLEFRVGDMIRIRNDDDVTQSVGPYVVEAGEEMVLQYGAPGVYEGYCPLSNGERYEIVVEP